MLPVGNGNLGIARPVRLRPGPESRHWYHVRIGISPFLVAHAHLLELNMKVLLDVSVV